MSGRGESIAAPITGVGTAPVHLVRMSGPAVRELLPRLCSRGAELLQKPRTILFGPIFDLLPGEGEGKGGDETHFSAGSDGGDAGVESSGSGKQLVKKPTKPPVLDHGLIVFFPGPNSFTGEDVAEFHLHGSPFIVRRLLAGLQANGVRGARAGEFTERAFLNGRMDLTQAEAVADLISAQTAVQARVAREQLEGRLSQAVGEFGEPLRDLLAEIEAMIDFPEEDIDPESYEGWQRRLAPISVKIAHALGTYSQGKLCREGALAVLAGAPNAGKSSLLNQLLGEERAIVTPIPGTTRDSIEEAVVIGGLPVRVCDTAGLVLEEKKAQRKIDEVEKLGIARSWALVDRADLVLFVVDGAELASFDTALAREVRVRARRFLLVLNKCDLLERKELEEVKSRLIGELQGGMKILPLEISAVSGDGLGNLKSTISHILLPDEDLSGTILVTTERHQEALTKAFDALERARLGIIDLAPAELVSADIRAALSALTEIVGVTHTEDILGRIFSKFCIGK